MAKKRLIVFASIFLTGVFSLFIGFLMVGFNISEFAFVGKYDKIYKEIDVNLNSKVVLRCEIEDIIIEQTDKDEICLTYFQSEKVKYLLTNENDILTLTKQDRKWSDYFEVNLQKKFVKVELPKNYLGVIEIYNEKGNISITDINSVSEIHVRGNDSDVKFKNIIANEISVENTSGDINAIGLSSTYEKTNYEFKTLSGVIEVDGVKAKNADSIIIFNSQSGKIIFNNVEIENVVANSDVSNISFENLLSDNINLKTRYVGSISGSVRGSRLDYFVEKTDISGGLDSNEGTFEDSGLTKIIKYSALIPVNIKFLSDEGTK